MFLNLQKNYEKIVEILNSDGVIAYPTEAVFGLGGLATSWAALEKINALKNRNTEQRALIVATYWAQVENWIHHPSYAMYRVASGQKRATTFLFPASNTAPEHLVFRGKIAIRLTGMRSLKKLCEYAPLLSTSANPTGSTAATTIKDVHSYFPNIPIVMGQTGGEAKPSQIMDWLSGRTLRL